MKFNVYFFIVTRIIILATAGIILSYLPEFYPKSFYNDYVDSYGSLSWGARHYWYFWMSFLLFCTSLVHCIMSLVALIEKEYPADKPKEK